MSDYDKEQKTEFVKQHKRMAMGVPLTGQTMQPTGNKSQSDNQSKPKGGLSQKKK
jgi:hypothetical protein